MIWPEFLSAEGQVLPDGEVPLSGQADMYVVDASRDGYHRSRIQVGTRGYFMEGPHRVAECHVVALGHFRDAI